PHIPLRTWIMAALLCFLAQTMMLRPVMAQQLRASRSHFSTDNGLASNAISDIVQDDYGFIWLGTWNGLSRFDGYNFYNYATGNASGIPYLHNRILKLYVDGQQNVWLRMYDGRVFVMKRNEDKIINPFADINGSSDYHTSYPLMVTSAGDVLAAIDGVGLFKLRMDRDGVSHELISTADLQITCMAEGYQNDIWLGTDQGVHRMDISSQTIERKGLFLDEYITCLFSNGYNIFAGTKAGSIYTFAYGQQPQKIRTGTEAINAVFVDSHGLVWFSDTRHGASKIDPKSGEEKLFTQTVTVPDYGGMGGMFNEKGGVVWIRMNHGGYGYYNRQKDEVEYFHNDPVNPWNLSNTVNAALELPEGVVFESTSRRGLEKLETMKNTIVRKLLVPTEGMSAANEVRAIFYDKQAHRLLMGNKSGSLFITERDSTQTVINHDSRGKSLGRIYGISKDAAGSYWIASKESGLFRMMPQAGGGYRIENYCHDNSNPESLSNDNAYYALEDRDGNIWVATYGGGVNLMVREEGGKVRFIHPQSTQMKDYPQHSHQKVRTLAMDNNGNIWAGTTDGILIMSLKGGKVKIEHLESSKEQPDKILMSNDIAAIARDRQGEMWVGTNGGGLAHCIGRDSKGRYLFDNLGTADGLPSEEILSLCFDSRGNVWFGADHIICSYDTGKRILTTFSSLDGVDETMLSENAAVTLGESDDMIFGTINGYYLIDREKLMTMSGSLLKLHITDFFMNDKLQSPRFTPDFSYYVPCAPKVELPSHNVSATFRFASLNYQLQHRVHYQYKLEGYDRTWQNADKSRTAHYNSLPTGKYRFVVRCFLLESPEKFDQCAIELEVPYPFMLSKFSIWIYMFIFALGAIILMFWQQRRLDKKEQLKRMQASPGEVEYQDKDEAVFMTRLMEWLDTNATNPNLTVNNMIEDSGLDAETFNRRLLQYTGLTPKDLIGDYRLNKALRFLEETDDGIAEIAYNSGYGDPTSFNRLFKSKMGMSPSSYRDESYRNHQDDGSTADDTVTVME
ncbi:MAG: helix-turn-helix domain-containing protein, partial [Prevotella sp.]|nr:helix-turn-helix domain-containing protein [Prevotella sp.]